MYKCIGDGIVLYVQVFGVFYSVIRTSVWGVYMVLYVQVFGVFI